MYADIVKIFLATLDNAAIKDPECTGGIMKINK